MKGWFFDPFADYMAFAHILLAASLLTLLLGGCASVPPNRLVAYPEADVLFTNAAEADRLCRAMPNAPPGAHYRGCYFPALKLAIVPHGDVHNLEHELRHAQEGRFHP